MTLQEFIKQYPIKTGSLTPKMQKAELSAFCMAIKLFKLMNWEIIKNEPSWRKFSFLSENVWERLRTSDAGGKRLKTAREGAKTRENAEQIAQNRRKSQTCFEY